MQIFSVNYDVKYNTQNNSWYIMFKMNNQILNKIIDNFILTVKCFFEIKFISIYAKHNFRILHIKFNIKIIDIKYLLLFIINKIIKNFNELENLCYICYDKMNNNSAITILKCSHSFHLECIIKWIKNHENCPYCRTKLFC